MHTSLTVLALSAVLSAAPAPRAASADPAKSAENWVTSLCRKWSADAANPWALAHGVGTFGAGFRASDGRLAIDAMLADSVLARGEGLYRLPDYMGSIPVDPHANHTVATLLAAGVPHVRVFKTRAGNVSLGQLAESVRRDFQFGKPDDRFWREHAWTLGALAAMTTEKSPKWKNKDGAELDLNVVLDAAVAYVREANSFLAEARAEGVAMMPKRKQGIWAHPCGGLHLVEGALEWAGTNKAFKERHAAAIAEQVDVLFYRVGLETLTYDDALAKAPEYALQLNVQRLKFYGHWLEVVTHLESQGLWKMTPERRKTLDKARAKLAETVVALKELRADERMSEFKAASPQTYLDLIGDSCHAATGLRESR